MNIKFSVYGFPYDKTAPGQELAAILRFEDAMSVATRNIHNFGHITIRKDERDCDVEISSIVATINNPDAECEVWWDKFMNTPKNPVTNCIEQDFADFPAGTHVGEILKWFDENHSNGVTFLLYEKG